MKYEIYGLLHKTAKKILNKNEECKYRMVSITYDKFAWSKKEILNNLRESDYINNIYNIDDSLSLNDVYPIENIIKKDSFKFLEDTYSLKKNTEKIKLLKNEKKALVLWNKFIENSKIPNGFKNGGLHYAGFILEENEWCLPSWIWTNAALARMYCRKNEMHKAKNIADKLLGLQETCGGWVVRNDYNEFGCIPVLAPNDSSYIANNCFLSMYLKTRELKYLESAKKCAKWIIETSRPDGLVYVGYDYYKKKWLKNYNIVDIGFTAGFFANLYTITMDEKYLLFLKNFLDKYIELFYVKKKHSFATSIDHNDEIHGGIFGRGQAWALEGLIPAYKVLKNEELKTIIDDTISTIISYQTKDGGWPYNFDKKLMGVDCKATSLIAYSLLEWYIMFPTNVILKNAIEKAYSWCVKHTAINDKYCGGIFSYSVEGAIVHHLYTNTAFVYSTSYAIELHYKLNILNIIES